MDRLIYTALTGLQRNQEAQAVTAHNLANAQTPGFRREMAALSSGWLDTSSGSGALSTRVQSGGESPHDLLRAGTVEATGNPLDIAMDGGAWLTVTDSTGQEALTRRGDLRLDADGRLATGDGTPVVGTDGPIQIAAGFAEVRIGRSGSIETRANAESPFVEVARLKLVSPDPASLSRERDGLFRSSDLPDADPLATVTTGALEKSNVDPNASLVELIEQSRAYEMQSKLIAAAREMDEGTASLMRVQ